MKKILLSLLLIFSLFSLTCCTDIGGNGKNIESRVDETTDELYIYVWASGVTSNSTFFTAEEIEVMKNCYSKNYPSVTTHWNIIQAVTKEEFGNTVNTNRDADIILAGANMNASDGCNITVKDSDRAKMEEIDSSWAKSAGRYVGIASICGSVHFQHALNFKDMVTSVVPDFFTSQNVLFIGNSYTYYNDLNIMFRNVCNSIGMNVSTEAVTKGSSSLSDFLFESSTEYQKVVTKLNQTKFNYVVLQDQSVRPASNPDAFYQSVEGMVSLIHKYQPNAKIVLFATWARAEGNEFYTGTNGFTYRSMALALARAYEEAGKRYNCLVAYSGIAVMDCYFSDNNIILYQNDLTHPTPSTTYMTAVIMANTIYGINPNEISYVPDYTITQGGSIKSMPTVEQCEILRNFASVVCASDFSLDNIPTE